MYPKDFSPELVASIQEWLDGPYDAQTKEEIRTLLQKNPSLLKEAFCGRLAFGTGGMRELMGVGTARINVYTIRTATQGLAQYILKQKKTNPRVVIGFDSRHNSQLFAEETARVLAGNGIHVLLMQELRPTPFISFAVRHLKCSAGVMITASHNPAGYNGYKVYWDDGGQVISPHDVGIIQEVDRVAKPEDVKLAELSSSSIEKVPLALDQSYLQAIRPLAFFPEQNKKEGAKLSISYTNLHGTGITLAPKALADWGFTQIALVQEQMKPDGDFPTVKFPNPEYPEALEMGIRLLEKTQGDLLIANDPDADRVGVVVRHAGKSVILTGNEIGSLCVHFISLTLKKPPKPAFITTIVSSDLMKTIAQNYGIPCFEVLTGFKYIAAKIHEWETSKEGYQFLFGAEESYGYLLGTVARDKDAILASCLIAEMALNAKLQGKTLLDQLFALYQTYGVFRENQYSHTFTSGAQAREEIANMMETLRKKPPQAIGGKKVVLIEDYSQRERRNITTNTKEKLTLPQSDVLLFRLEDASKIVIRPSGTEPKIKLYAGVHIKSFPSVAEGITIAEHSLDSLIQSFKQETHLV